VSSEHTHLSSADVAWLHMDRPTNLMVINSVLLFDERLDWERLTEVVRARLVEAYPRFRERVIDNRLRPTGPHWEDDPDFDLARHLHRRGLPAPADESALQALVADLASVALERSKPLWDMYFIDGPGHGSAVIVRMHHCIADGIALAQVLLSLTDTSSSSPAEPPQLPVASPHSSSVLRTAIGVSLSLLNEARRTLARPRQALELAGAVAANARAAAKLLLTAPDPASLLKRDHGATRGVAWSEPLSLEQARSIAHAQGATVNDVLLTAVSGALRDYLLAHGEEPQAIRAMVPVNLRAREEPVPRELGNRFGLVYLTLPVDRSSRRERLSELKRRMDEIKDSPEGPVSYALLETVGLAPQEIESRLVDLITAKATAVMTNVPGPRDPVFLAGSPLRTVLVWAPTAGSVGMSVSIFSYGGKITVGVLVHAQLVPDPHKIVGRLQRELTAMARLAPVARAGAA